MVATATIYLTSCCSLGLDHLATGGVFRIHCSLALDAAVPIEMASAATFRGDPDLFWTVWVGAGLASPITARTLVWHFTLVAILPGEVIDVRQRCGLELALTHAAETERFTTRFTGQHHTRNRAQEIVAVFHHARLSSGNPRKKLIPCIARIETLKHRI